MEIGQGPLSIAYLSLPSEKQITPNYLSHKEMYMYINDQDRLCIVYSGQESLIQTFC